jgi:hypothetical protein
MHCLNTVWIFAPVESTMGCQFPVSFHHPNREDPKLLWSVLCMVAMAVMWFARIAVDFLDVIWILVSHQKQINKWGKKGKAILVTGREGP